MEEETIRPSQRSRSPTQIDMVEEDNKNDQNDIHDKISRFSLSPLDLFPKLLKARSDTFLKAWRFFLKEKGDNNGNGLNIDLKKIEESMKISIDFLNQIDDLLKNSWKKTMELLIPNNDSSNDIKNCFDKWMKGIKKFSSENIRDARIKFLKLRDLYPKTKTHNFQTFNPQLIFKVVNSELQKIGIDQISSFDLNKQDLAVGNKHGQVYYWDGEKLKKILEIESKFYINLRFYNKN